MNYYCKDCGSQDIEARHWVNINNDEVGSILLGGDDDYYCNGCDDNVDIVEIDPKDDLNNVKEEVSLTFDLDDFEVLIGREPTSKEELLAFVSYLRGYTVSLAFLDDERDWNEWWEDNSNFSSKGGV